jgi:tetrahydromethanopterin S-methyltransferase subunit G
VPTLEERVAFIEGQMSEQSHALLQVRDAVGSLEHRIDARFEAIDRRFEAVDRRFETIDRRFDSVDRRIDRLDDKVSRHFLWLVGLQITTLLAVVSALLARG